MPIIHYPGFITKEEAARREGVQVRTINSHIKKKTIGFVKIDKRILIKETTSPSVPPPGVVPGELMWVRNFAVANHIATDRVYEQIVMGNITGVVIADRVFVMRNEPALVAFLKEAIKK